MRLFQFYEESNEHGITSTLNKFVFRNTEFVVVAKDLTDLKPAQDSLLENGLRFLDISSENLKKTDIRYPVKSRYYKLLKYTEKGYHVFAVVKGDELIGDVGYMTDEMSRLTPIRDLKWFGIELGEREAYMFDMFVSAHQRENNVTNLLVSNALNALKEKGKLRAYGYYDSDNIPALWFHRMHGYKELDKVKIQQFFVFKRVVGDSLLKQNKKIEITKRRTD